MKFSTYIIVLTIIAVLVFLGVKNIIETALTALI